MRDEREFERLYLANYKFVYNYVRYRMADADAAEDVVAEAFLYAARSFKKFDPHRAKFSTWVTRIAINCMNTYYRSTHVNSTLEDVPDSVAAVAGEEDAICNRDLVAKLLGVLSPQERELVLMKYQEGKRNVDIAQELGMNASTVSTNLAKALHKMRISMERTNDG